MLLVGRKNQLKSVDLILKSKKSEFVAVVGRRRVGKTYFIEAAFQKNICFRLTGIQDGTLAEQLTSFAIKMAEHMGNPFVPTPPENWQQSFYQLKAYLKSLDKKRKRVIFIDELPWIATPRSGFLKMLAHFWNDYLSKEKHFVLVVCGSATAWITNNVINDKGGLHNRISHTIHLRPFDLAETKAFLESKKIALPDQEITKLYMAMGGIPYYLENIRKGETAATTIERMCFHPEGILKKEYNNLYRALFYNYRDHQKIIKVLAKSKKGLTREDLLKKSKVVDGGTFNRTMEDLILSNFIAEYNPFNKIKRGSLYRLEDEYSIFYHRFIQPNMKYAKGMWLQLSNGQAYKSWTGYAFESLCFKHIDNIKEALGIAAVYTQVSSYQLSGNKKRKGFQIDLVIKRSDNAIHLCEVKYYDGNFKMDGPYAARLNERKKLFRESTGTNAALFTTLIVNNDLMANEHAEQVVDSCVTLKEMLD
ncbi:MAG: AAA family ATPase [Crocinitomix sp.]|nr:AAA family ATPase [Crocinitomix sp.]